MRNILTLLALLLLWNCVVAVDINHVYLSLTGNVSELQLTFTTSSPPVQGQVIYFATNIGIKYYINLLPSVTQVFVTPFNVTEYITSVTFTNLQPATRYTYNILPYWNRQFDLAQYSFTTLPADADPVNILMYGDLGSEGTSITSGALYGWANRRAMDFVVHYGDLAYNLATQNATVGEAFMNNIQNISASYPYVVLPGNHEYMDNKTDEMYYKGWFRGQSKLGSNSASDDPVSYHSYDIGDKVHFIGINTEVYCEDPAHVVEQWFWLKKDLESVRLRPVQPWIVVYGHRQMYEGTNSHFHTFLMRYGLQCTDATLLSCNVTEPCYSGVNCGYSLESLFQEFKIDVFIAGHLHSYVRMFPISNSSTYEAQSTSAYFNPNNPVYIISGAAGDQNTVQEKVEYAETADTTPNAMTSGNFSLSLLTVYNNTFLRFKQVLLNNDVLDEFWIVKDGAIPPVATLVSFTISNVTDSPLCNQ